MANSLQVASFANAPHSLFYFWWFILCHAYTIHTYTTHVYTRTQPTKVASNLELCWTPFARFVQIKCVCMILVYLDSDMTVLHHIAFQVNTINVHIF